MSTLDLQKKLNGYFHKNIKDICINSYTANTDNHCAHFVNHAMLYNVGFRCKGMAGKGEGDGASIRVNEIFRFCPKIGVWKDKPAGDCLASITSTDNVNIASKFMGTRPRKHIGVFCGGSICHNSNSKNTVVSQSPQHFAFHYTGS